MTIQVTFACGRQIDIDKQASAAVCPDHGPELVVRVKAPAPRFTGSVSGPCAAEK